MVSAFTLNKHLEQPANNDYVNSWDIPVNADWALIDKALGGTRLLNLTGLSGNLPLVALDYQPLKIVLSGSPTAAVTLVVPTGVGGLWVMRNDTTGGFVISIVSAAGGSAVAIPVAANTLVTCDGTVSGMSSAVSAVIASSITNTGPTTLAGTTVSAPNGLAWNTNQWVLGSGPGYNQVAIGTATMGSEMLTVAGTIKSTTGGYVFPDGTVQTTASQAPTGTVFSGYYGGTAPTGFVLADGRTIGSVASNATNRANADCQNLFTLLWNITAQAQCPVTTSSGGASSRGADALADWTDNKRLALPDHSGRTMAGRDNLSGTNRNVLSPSGIASTTRAAIGGEALHVLSEAELAVHTHLGAGGFSIAMINAGTFAGYTQGTAGNYVGYTDSTAAAGSSTGHNTAQPTIVVDVIIAL